MFATRSHKSLRARIFNLCDRCRNICEIGNVAENLRTNIFEYFMNNKLSKIKKIIKTYKEIDGDFWFYEGNDLIYQILDTFDEIEWENLKLELNNLKDYEHSIFSRVILSYDTDRIVDKVDVYEIFFTEFVLLSDLDDADCLLQDIMYLKNIRKPKLDLLEKVKEKIKILKNFKETVNEQNMFEFAEKTVEEVIKKHYG